MEIDHPFLEACSQGNYMDLGDIREEHRELRDGEGRGPLHLAVLSLSIPTVEMLLESGLFNIEEGAGPRGSTPLHIASLMGPPEMIRILLGAGADPERAMPNGNRALHLAALHSPTPNESIRELILKGADPNSLGTRGRSALWSVANRRSANGTLTTLESLARAGWQEGREVDVNMPENTGAAPGGAGRPWILDRADETGCLGWVARGERFVA